MSAGDDIERVKDAVEMLRRFGQLQLRHASLWPDGPHVFPGAVCDALAALDRLQGRLAAAEETLEAIRDAADHSRGFHEGSVLDRIYFAADAALESRP